MFSIFMRFQNATENVVHGFGNLVIWVWKNRNHVYFDRVLSHFLLYSKKKSEDEMLFD